METNECNELRAELDKIKTTHYRELSEQLVQDNESLEEQLKAKDEEIDELSQNVDNLNEACERAYGTIERLMDLLLKAEPAIPDGFPVVDEIRRELSAYDTTDSHEEIIKRRFDTIDSLTSEVERLKEVLKEAKPYIESQYRQSLNSGSSHQEFLQDDRDLMARIDTLLSQSTDKPK